MPLKDASKTPTLLGLDAKAFAFTFPAFLFINTWTMSYVIFTFALFIILKIKRLPIGYAYRRLISSARSKTVSSRPWWVLKKWRIRT